MPTFTNFHAPYEPAWRELFFNRLKWDVQAPRTIVEVGSFEGSSAWWIMNNLLLAPESQLYCIDVWPERYGGEATYQGFMNTIGELPNRSQVEVMRDWSHNALRELIVRGVKADVLYIDGGHDAPTVLRDVVTGFDLLKPGGVMICDDYLWDNPQRGGQVLQGRPKMSLDAFTTIYCDKLKVIQGLPLRQLYIYKLSD